jgi:hypothetical protein
MSQTNADVRPSRTGLIAALLAAVLIVAAFRENQPKQGIARNPAASVNQSGNRPGDAAKLTEPAAAIEPGSLPYVPRDALAVAAVCEGITIQETSAPAPVAVPALATVDSQSPTPVAAPPGADGTEPVIPAASVPVPASMPTEAQPPRVRSNQDLANAVASALKKANLSGFEIEISVQKGVATLDGDIATVEQRERAMRATESVKGISKINNRLAVREISEEDRSNGAANDGLPVLVEELALSQRQWEYKLLRVDEQKTDDLDGKLNELGARGWELIAARGASSNSKTSLYFKRQKVQELR